MRGGRRPGPARAHRHPPTRGPWPSWPDVPWSGSVVLTSGSTTPVSTCSACWRQPHPRPSGGCWRPTSSATCTGPARCCPTFRHQGHGVLIDDASVYSHVGAPWLTAYVSSKFAVRGFSEALRQELDFDLPDVHVCTVSPSPIDTADLRQRGQLQRPGRSRRRHPPIRPSRWPARSWPAPYTPSGEADRGGAGRLVTVAEADAPRRFKQVNRRYVNGLQFAAEPAPPPMATCSPTPSPTAALRPAAAGGAGPTRRPRSAGWPRLDYWPPAHSPSHGSSPAPAGPDRGATAIA